MPARTSEDGMPRCDSRKPASCLLKYLIYKPSYPWNAQLYELSPLCCSPPICLSAWRGIAPSVHPSADSSRTPAPSAGEGPRAIPIYHIIPSNSSKYICRYTWSGVEVLPRKLFSRPIVPPICLLGTVPAKQTAHTLPTKLAETHRKSKALSNNYFIMHVMHLYLIRSICEVIGATTYSARRKAKSTSEQQKSIQPTQEKYTVCI